MNELALPSLGAVGAGDGHAPRRHDPLRPRTLDSRQCCICIGLGHPDVALGWVGDVSYRPVQLGRESPGSGYPVRTPQEKIGSADQPGRELKTREER